MNVDDVIRYECGEMSQEEEVKFFAGLIESGMCWQLQGHYGRTAMRYIESGIINEKGEVVDLTLLQN